MWQLEVELERLNINALLCSVSKCIFSAGNLIALDIAGDWDSELDREILD